MWNVSRETVYGRIGSNYTTISYSVKWNISRPFSRPQRQARTLPRTLPLIQEPFNDLVVATYGRGFWILDDVTPLRALTPAALNADAHLDAFNEMLKRKGL